MILIFAVDEEWKIGYRGDLLYKISEDLKRFRMLTTGNIIIMGRKTFESLPESKALPDRINIIMTRKKDYNPPNTIVVNSKAELMEVLEEINSDKMMVNYVIGGGIIAKELLEYCHKAYITKIYRNFKEADAYLHNLDKDEDWEIEHKSEVLSDGNVKYQYVDYKRINMD